MIANNLIDFYLVPREVDDAFLYFQSYLSAEIESYKLLFSMLSNIVAIILIKNI